MLQQFMQHVIKNINETSPLWIDSFLSFTLRNGIIIFKQVRVNFIQFYNTRKNTITTIDTQCSSFIHQQYTNNIWMLNNNTITVYNKYGVYLFHIPLKQKYTHLKEEQGGIVVYNYEKQNHYWMSSKMLISGSSYDNAGRYTGEYQGVEKAW
jgi:hypothetical protein